MRVNLSGDDWTIQGFLPGNQRFNAESGIDFHVPPMTPVFPAKVPGSVHDDLQRAGYIQDPYYERNCLDVEWVENKTWLYRKPFIAVDDWCLKKARLCYEGVNHRARFYLDGHLLGTHANMFVPVRFDISGKLEPGSHILEVLVENLPEEQSQMGETSSCRELTSRFGYGWDFCTRMACPGIWQDAWLEISDGAFFGDLDVKGTREDQNGKIQIKGTIDRISSGEPAPLDVMARLSFDGAEQVVANASVDREGRFEITFHLADPALWWPSGSGRQPLYVLDLELLSDNDLQDRRSLKVGVRTLSYQRCTDSPTDSIPYVVVINDCPIWIKGVNFLPIDHRFGAVDKDRYIRQVQRLKDAGVNLIRIWGGAYIEKEWLYDLCDENGILIWQELPQSNSGLDGVPSRDPLYRLALRDAAVHALKEKRNHVSLTIWDGGNELKDAARRPAGMGDEVLQELGSLVQEHDPERIFHPSSPSGPNFNLDTSVEAMREGKNHNIHGQWVYLGTKAHYSYYDSSNSLFNAEFGANGASDEESLARFLKPETLLAYREDDPTWLLHGNGWWNSWHRDAALFGAERLDSPGRFSAASQFVQAEAIRYAIESCRRRSFNNAGCIIWQFSEPWPNVNCSNLIDWYERPKMAYHAASQAFRTLHPCLRYDQWVYPEGATFEAEAHILNSGAPVKGRLEAEILDLEGQQLHSIAWYLEVHENQNVLAGRIRMDLPQLPGSIFFVRLRLTLDIGERIETLLTFGVEEDLPQGKAPFRGLMVRSDASLRASCRMIAEDEASIELENLGAHAVVGISIYRQDGNPTWIDNGFSTLFPGESIRIRARGLEEGVPLVAKDLARNIRVPIPWIHDGQGCAETVVKNP